MRYFLSALLICFTMLPTSGLAAPGDQGRKTPPPLVKTREVELQNVNPPQEYVGHVQAIQSVRLRARVEGYLEKIKFREGSLVQKGDLLYVIEQPPYKANLASAKAKVAQAKAELFKAKSRLRRLRTAKAESVPRTKMEDAIAAKDLAKGRLQQARANLDTARINMDYTTVKAPVSGRIGKSDFDRGDLVSPGSGTLAQIKQIDPIRVVFSVGEKNIPLIQNATQDMDRESKKRNLTVKLQFPDGSSYPHEGEIEFLDNKMDRSTGTIAVWAKFDNPQGKLIPGEYANVLLTRTKPEMLPVVPLSSVQRDQEGAFVLLVDKRDKVHKRRIETEKIFSGKAAVSSDLEKGEKVIVEGIQKAKPGKTVQLSEGEK